MFSIKALTLSAAVAAPLVLGTTASAALTGEIKIDGSSTVFPITQAVAEEFAEANKGVKIDVKFSGTGGGMKKFAKGETDISNASRPIKGKEAKAVGEAGIEFIEVPVAYDGLTIVINKNNNWGGELTVDQIRKIFIAPGAKTWKEVDEKFPEVPIKLYTPGEASGTYDYFVEVVCGKKDKKTGKHKYGELRGDLSKSEDDNVLVTGVTGDPGAIGFFGAAYYFENADKLGAVSVVNKDGKAVGPSAEAIEDGSYNPFSRPLFVYIKTSSLERPEVAAFIDFYFNNGPELAEEVGYVRLPSAIYDAAKSNVKNKKTGSQYLDANGDKVDGPVTSVYKKL